MNFDANMISALLQALSPKRQEPPREETPKFGGATSFIRENGIGERVDLSKKNDPSPMASILDMMGGKQKAGGDGLAGMLPMLLNMFGGKSAQTASTPNAERRESDHSSAERRENDGNNAHNGDRDNRADDLNGKYTKNATKRDLNDCKYDCNSRESERGDQFPRVERDMGGYSRSERDINGFPRGESVKSGYSNKEKYTNGYSRDKNKNNGFLGENGSQEVLTRPKTCQNGVSFEPITFAGYALISALNILFAHCGA